MIRSQNALLTFIILIGFMIRLGTAYMYPNIVHPDEMFQYIEQAFRILTGSGLIPWEFQIGSRSWLIPFILSGAMSIGHFFIAGPDGYNYAITMLMVALSTIIPISAYFTIKNFYGSYAGLSAALITGTWYELIFYLVHPLSEVFTTYPLLIAMTLCTIEPLKTNKFVGPIIGACLTLAIAFRLQIFPAALLIYCYSLYKFTKAESLRMTMTIAVGIILIGLFDKLTWGDFYQSYLINLKLNQFHSLADAFGVKPWFYYFYVQYYYWYAFAVLFFILAIIGSFRIPLFGAIVFIIYISHSMIPHKEFRFIVPAIPATVILIISGTFTLIKKVKILRTYSIHTSSILVSLFFLSTSTALFSSPLFSKFFNEGRAQFDIIQRVNADPQACGIGVAPSKNWFDILSSAYIRRDIKLISGDATEGLPHSISYNYLITFDKNINPDVGYEKLTCFENNWEIEQSRICLYRRPGSCADIVEHRLIAVTPQPVSDIIYDALKVRVH